MFAKVHPDGFLVCGENVPDGKPNYEINHRHFVAVGGGTPEELNTAQAQALVDLVYREPGHYKQYYQAKFYDADEFVKTGKFKQLAHISLREAD